MPCPTCTGGRVVAVGRLRRQVDGPRSETLWLGACAGCGRWWLGLALQRRAWPLLEHEGWRLGWTMGSCPDPVDPLCRCLAHRLMEREHLDLLAEMRTALALAEPWPAERWPLPDLGELNDVWGWHWRRHEAGRSATGQDVLEDLLALAERGLLPFGPKSEGARAGVWCSRVRRLLSHQAQAAGDTRLARRHARAALTVLERVWTRPGGTPVLRGHARRSWLAEGGELVRHHLDLEDALGAARVADAILDAMARARLPEAHEESWGMRDEEEPELLAMQRELRALRPTLPDPLEDNRAPSPEDDPVLSPPLELRLGRGLWDTVQGRPGLARLAARGFVQRGLPVPEIPLVEEPALEPWEAAWALRGRLAWRGAVGKDPDEPVERSLLAALESLGSRVLADCLDTIRLDVLAGRWLGAVGWWGTEWPWPWPPGVVVEVLQEALRLGGRLPEGPEGWQALFEVAAGGEKDVAARWLPFGGGSTPLPSTEGALAKPEARLLVPWVALTLTVSRLRLGLDSGFDVRTVRLMRRTGELAWRLCVDDDEEGRVMPDPWVPPLLEAVHRCPRPGLATCSCLGHEVMRDFLDQSGVPRRLDARAKVSRERRVVTARRPLTELVPALADAARKQAGPLLEVEAGSALARCGDTFSQGRLDGERMAPWHPDPVLLGEGKGLGPLDFRIRVGGQLVLEETLGRVPDGWWWILPPAGHRPESASESAGIWVEADDPYLGELRAGGHRVLHVWSVVHEAAKEAWEAVASQLIPPDALKQWLNLQGERAEADIGRAYAGVRGLMEAGFALGDPVMVRDVLEMGRWHRWTTAQLVANLQARLSAWRTGGRDLEPGWVAVLPWPGRWRDLGATDLASTPAPLLRQLLPPDVREGLETALAAFAGLGQPPFVGLDAATPEQVVWIRRLLPGARVVSRQDLLPGVRWFELIPG